jgi:Txe/YoeB family toxin of Txe-Axe toxin-antitoxin module
MLDEQANKKLETIQLSNNTVHRRIQDLLADIQLTSYHTNTPDTS